MEYEQAARPDEGYGRGRPPTAKAVNWVVLALGLVAVGCGSDVVDLVDSPWKALEVEYCTPTEDRRIWRTSDPEELEGLRAAMAPQQPEGLTMILKSYTNEIRLELASGQRWNLYFRDRPHSVTLYDPDSIKRSFVVPISRDFYSRLGSALKTSGGEPISLRGDCRIPAMQ